MNNSRLAWHHIRRSPFQSLIAILIMAIVFFIANTFFIIGDGMTAVLTYFETKPEVTIFLKDGLDKPTVESIQSDLANYPSVKEIKYISKDMALNLYKEQNKNNPMLTEMVTSSILPASFEVSVSDPKVLEQIYSDFSTKTKLIDEVIYQKDVVQTLLNLTSTIRKTGIITIISFGVVSFFVIFVIIGMKITNRKEEISVCRLLGASKYFVQQSFLLEGIFYGLVGSLIGFSASLLGVYLLGNQINQFFLPITFIRLDWFFYVELLTVEISVGVFLGWFSSWIVTRRHLKY